MDSRHCLVAEATAQTPWHTGISGVEDKRLSWRLPGVHVGGRERTAAYGLVATKWPIMEHRRCLSAEALPCLLAKNTPWMSMISATSVYNKIPGDYLALSCDIMDVWFLLRTPDTSHYDLAASLYDSCKLRQTGLPYYPANRSDYALDCIRGAYGAIVTSVAPALPLTISPAPGEWTGQLRER